MSQAELDLVAKTSNGQASRSEDALGGWWGIALYCRREMRDIMILGLIAGLLFGLVLGYAWGHEVKGRSHRVAVTR